MKSTQIELGMEVQDKVTGFSGIVTGKADYLTGCTQFSVTPRMGVDDKTIPDNAWFDEGRLEYVGSGITAASVAGSVNGGPRIDYPSKG